MAGYESIFSSELGQVTLIFVLVFTVVFAVLQKAKVFGDGKKQIDALVGLAVGLIVISAGYATDIISKLIPFLAISLVIILVFMVLIGFLFKEGSFEMPAWLKMGIGILIFLALVIAVLYVTGAWAWLVELFFSEGSGSAILTNVVLIVVLIAVVAAVIFGSGKGKEKKD